MNTTMTAITAAAAVIAAAVNAGDPVELHFDVESTSLRGEGFPFGGFVRQNGVVIADFSAMSAEGAAKCGDWVKANVLPHIADIPVVETQADLHAAFWAVYKAAREATLAAYGCKPWELAGKFVVFGDNMWPVESSFLTAAHDWAMANAGAGEFDGPYMPIDVTSALAVLGYNPDLPRAEAAADLGVTGPKHNPVIDARQSAAVYDAACNGTLDAKYRV